MIEDQGSALVDARDRELIKRVFSAPLEVPQEWLSWLISYIESHPPVLPISQIFGFTGFTAQIDQVAAYEQRNSATYGDLATVGPEITGLAKGRYVLLYGAQAVNGNDNVSNTYTAYMSPSINGSTPSDSDAARSLGSISALVNSSVMSATIADLSLDGDNSVKCQYKITQATVNPGDWGNRFLIAIRVANL